MAENLVGKKPWYPNPTGAGKDRNFVYLDTLREDSPKIYNKAQSLFSSIEGKIFGSLWPQMNDLLQLAKREQEKEDRLLDLFFNEGRAGNDPRKTAEKLQSFNKIYQKKSILERNLKKIKAFESGETRSGKIDISSLFTNYLMDELKDLDKKSLKQLNYQYFSEITKQALVKMFNSADLQKEAGNEDAMRSYQEISEWISNMSASDAYIRQICDLYFGTSLDKIQKEIKNSGGRKRKSPASMLSKQRGAHGTVFELTNELIYKHLGFNSQHSGSSGQKADHILLYEAEINLEMPAAPIEDSVREHFIEQYQKLYNSLENVSGQIVEISDKNYDLGGYWFKKNGGFTAQSGISIKNFEKTLQGFGYDQSRLDNLIFALLNIGPDTLQVGSEVVAKNISSLIAYFLFDDIDMDIGLKVDAVHLFNLNGIYIPLSAFLFAAYEAFFEANYDFEGFIQVNYEPNSVGYAKQEKLEKQNWIEVKEEKLSQKSLSIHFMKSFAKFVSQYL